MPTKQGLSGGSQKNQKYKMCFENPFGTLRGGYWRDVTSPSFSHCLKTYQRGFEETIWRAWYSSPAVGMERG